jgi:hypothetical protein
LSRRATASLWSQLSRRGSDTKYRQQNAASWINRHAVLITPEEKTT